MNPLPVYLVIYSDPQINIALLAGLILVIGFLGYHFLGNYIMTRAENHARQALTGKYKGHILKRLIGFTLMGAMPFMLYYYLFDLSPVDYGINLKEADRSLLWVLIFIPIILGLNYYVTKKPSSQKHYPQIRLTDWNLRDLTLNFVTWTLYLLGYEMLFRGFLLFSFHDAFGPRVAIILNVVFYVLAHIPKGIREMAGSIPFGIILCLITLDTGSFFAAFLIHASMALSTEFFSIRAHPGMKIKSIRI